MSKIRKARIADLTFIQAQPPSKWKPVWEAVAGLLPGEAVVVPFKAPAGKSIFQFRAYVAAQLGASGVRELIPNKLVVKVTEHKEIAICCLNERS